MANNNPIDRKRLLILTEGSTEYNILNALKIEEDFLHPSICFKAQNAEGQNKIPKELEKRLKLTAFVGVYIIMDWDRDDKQAILLKIKQVLKKYKDKYDYAEIIINDPNIDLLIPYFFTDCRISEPWLKTKLNYRDFNELKNDINLYNKIKNNGGSLSILENNSGNSSMTRFIIDVLKCGDLKKFSNELKNK